MDLCTLTSLADTGHSRKVSEISGLVAGFMGYSRDESELIGKAALYHDVGKSRVPREFLDKAGPLTEQEYETVKQHARLGGEMILGLIRILCAAYMMAVNHHERLDGSGAASRLRKYPCGSVLSPPLMFSTRSCQKGRTRRRFPCPMCCHS